MDAAVCGTVDVRACVVHVPMATGLLVRYVPAVMATIIPHDPELPELPTVKVDAATSPDVAAFPQRHTNG